MSIVKSYIGNTQKEAFDKVRADLGEEAVIINTRLIRKKGFLNLFKKPLVEVTAVVDNITGQTTAIGRRRITNSSHSVLQNQVNQINQVEDTLKNNVNEEKLEELEKQMSHISELVTKVYNKIDTVDYSKIVDDDLQYLFDTLVQNDVLEEFAFEIIEKVKKKRDENIDENVLDIAVEIIKRDLGRAQPIRNRRDKKNVIIFLGPTGVGKTTTIAKIASIYALGSKTKVSLITEDTYRIGAVEQLKIYADILGIDLDVIYSPDEIIEKLENDSDIVLIDTAGKGPKDKNYHENMNSLIENSNPTEVFLVLSSTTGYETAVSILETYDFIKNYRLIFTKADEYGKLGFIYNIRKLSGKPIAYITNGQNVAEDIFIPNPTDIAKSLCER